VKLPEKVTIYEVGPRDGLQNEQRRIPTSDKLRLIHALLASGIRDLEITSFVSPKWIPQLADHAEVARGVQRPPGVRMSALVPNRRGLDTAIASGMKEIAVFMSASEAHNKKNINKTIAETLAVFDEVVGRAREAGLAVRAYLSTAFGYLTPGDVPPDQVVELTGKLSALGVYQIAISDTIGFATPGQVEDVLGRVVAKHPVESLAVHFHDTEGMALANCLVALRLGITTIDAAAGGLGGCNYARGAAGNVATEDVVNMLHRMGVATGIDLDRLIEAARLAASFMVDGVPSKYLRAHAGRRDRERRGTELDD
jgi:hydroxymethylglutaryl-CoA lyase